MKTSLSIALLTILLSATASAAPPKNAESEYLVTTSSGFYLHPGSAFYSMTFNIIKALPEAYHLKFIFQNPNKKQPAITETQALEVDGEEIRVASVPLQCVRNNKKFLVTVEIYSDESESELVSTHKQKVEFRTPKEIISHIGLKLC